MIVSVKKAKELVVGDPVLLSPNEITKVRTLFSASLYIKVIFTNGSHAYYEKSEPVEVLISF